MTRVDVIAASIPLEWVEQLEEIAIMRGWKDSREFLCNFIRKQFELETSYDMESIIREIK